MKVNEIMTAPVISVDIGTSIQAAAAQMHKMDIGALVVSANDQIVGMVTDRDITVRAVANAAPADTPVGNVMSEDIRYCFDDDDIDHVIKNMGDNGVRRLPVVNREKRLVGILSLGNVIHAKDGTMVKNFCYGVASPH
ncbi:CBS domain-containing protein [Pseudomonas syringae]|nr:CBS domain-containing protein [Pseudomonas syringae]